MQHSKEFVISSVICKKGNGMSINFNPNKWGPFTILVFVLAIIFVAVGGVVVIRGNMTYMEYLNQLKWFGGIVAVSGIGKGLFNFGEVTNPPSSTVVNNMTPPPTAQVGNSSSTVEPPA